ncbi:MAG TPA: EAL domain-containing protein, partial [Acidimicrobiales bacterium]|nr:EAL domain-containing protein [Acidimicrobiales bacterium]
MATRPAPAQGARSTARPGGPADEGDGAPAHTGAKGTEGTQPGGPVTEGPGRAAAPRQGAGPAAARSRRHRRALALAAARRRAEAELRRRDEQLAETQSLAGMGHWQWEVADGRLRWSAGMFAVFGVEDDAGPTFELLHRAVHPDDRERVERVVAEAMEAGRPFSVEHRVVLPGGDLRWVQARGKVVLDAGGAPVRFYGTAQDVTDRRRAEHALVRQALHDPLTGLPNRALFFDRLEQALRAKGRRGCLAAVLFVDLDRFKLVNDSYGHAAGDKVLVAVADRLGGVLRPGDTLARLAGDEFTVLCAELPDEASVLAVAERVLAAFERPVPLDRGRQAFVTASVGVAVAGRADASADDLLSHADSAMYQAKDLGRNRIEVFDSAMRAKVVARAEQAAGLRRAVDRGELRVHYQPEVRLSDETVCGVEALVRWQHPERGLIGPAEFIAVAEETGLVVGLGAEVLRTACHDLERLSVLAPGALTVSVNLSARQLVEPGVIDTVWEQLCATGMDPARLRLEITESVLLEDVSTSVEALLGLRALGVQLAIDDFGTGYSSLSYLRRFPVDAVKVDRSFVAGLGDDPAAEAIVAAVVNLAHALGLAVVAEGVETEQQLVILRALGCDRAQGHLWSPARPVDELRRWRRSAGPAEATAVDLGALLAERTEAARRRADRPILLQLPGALPPAEGAPRAVGTVVDQLLDNALTFSPADRPVVVTAAPGRRWVRFSVADFGIGMTADEVARCFEQFWQGHSGAPFRRGGTGIGLSSVRSLVEGMG